MTILVYVINQELRLATPFKTLIDGTQEFIKFKFLLDNAWAEITTFAQFTQNDVAYNVYLDEDNCVYLPPEINTGTFTLMLYGTGDNTIGTSNYLTIKMDDNILIENAQSTEITESLYTQLVNSVNNVNNNLNTITTARTSDVGKYLKVKSVNNGKVSAWEFDTNGGSGEGGSGQDGQDGYSPTITVTNITGGHRVTITDVNGTKRFDVMDGTKGSNGVSPTVTVVNITGGHRVSITDATGTKTFDVMNGSGSEDGGSSINVDDTLTVSGAAADAKVTGNAIKAGEEAITKLERNVDNKIADLKSMVGTPLKASTASAMNNSEKIYVYTGSESGYTNGHWYYYDGSKWVDGGVYNSTAVETDKTLSVENMPADAKKTGDEINTLKEDFNDIFIQNLFDVNSDTYVENAYIDGSGNIVQANGYFISNHIAVNPGDTFVATYTNAAGLTNVRVFNKNGGRIGNVTGVLSSDGTYSTFTIPTTFTTAAYMTVNGRTEVLSSYMIIAGTEYPSEVINNALAKNVKISLTEDYQKLTNDSVDISNVLGMISAGEQTVSTSVAVRGYFVNATNDSINASSNFNISNSIALEKGQIISVTAQGYSTVVGMICIYDVVNDKYLTVVASTDNTLKEYTYTASQKCSVRISYNKTYTPVVKIMTTDTTSTVLNDLIDANQKTIIEYPQIFDNAVFIGDSLTYGHDGNTRLMKNYPYFFGKLADCEISNQGLSGRTAKQWWYELGVSFDFTGYDCAIIYLGTNQGLTDTVDTDCNASDYTQNADTNTGCYGKIIGKIQATNSNCKIFLIAGPEEYHSRVTAMNPAVRSLAEFYGCGLIDMEDSILSDDGSTTSAERELYRPVDGIHYDALGYLTFANITYDIMTKWISTHLTNYKN